MSLTLSDNFRLRLKKYEKYHAIIQLMTFIHLHDHLYTLHAEVTIFQLSKYWSTQEKPEVRFHKHLVCHCKPLKFNEVFLITIIFIRIFYSYLSRLKLLNIPYQPIYNGEYFVTGCIRPSAPAAIRCETTSLWPFSEALNNTKIYLMNRFQIVFITSLCI